MLSRVDLFAWFSAKSGVKLNSTYPSLYFIYRTAFCLMVRNTKIINATYEETVYRLDALGNAVSFVEWHKNAVTIDPAFLANPVKFPAPDTFGCIERKIQNAKNLKLNLFGGESVE
jgi:hypothetical protein